MRELVLDLPLGEPVPAHPLVQGPEHGLLLRILDPAGDRRRPAHRDNGDRWCLDGRLGPRLIVEQVPQ